MKIVFVCTGNASRSAVAEVILRKMIQEKNLEDIEVSSCGTDVPYGQEREGIMCQIAAEHGYSMGGKAVMITAELVNAADRIIVMTRQHKTEVIRLLDSSHIGIVSHYLTTSVSENLQTFPDPHYQSAQVYYTCFNTIEKGCREIVREIEIIEPLSPSLSCFPGVNVPGLFLGLYIILIFSSSKKFLDNCLRHFNHRDIC